MGIFSKKKNPEENHLSEVKRGVMQANTPNPSNAQKPLQSPPQRAAVSSNAVNQPDPNLHQQPANPATLQKGPNTGALHVQDVNLKPPTSNTDSVNTNIENNKLDSSLDLFNLKDLNLDLDDLGESNEKNESTASSTVDKPSHSEEHIDLSKYKTESLDHVNTDKPIFISTEQFKKVIDNIEYVKSKIKTATDTYIRILDIKSEEDLEFDNLKKDFQSIEDKLYEIDSILFEENGL